MSAITLPFPVSPRLLAAAPHRMLFAVGAANVLLAMSWWALWLIAARWPLFALPVPAEPPGWMHAFVMQYQVLPPFIFGFLLTVFPRWHDLPALTRWHYVPVGLGLLGGQALVLAGLLGHPNLVLLGLFQTLAGWIAGTVFLLNVLAAARRVEPHAIACATGLLLGAIGLALTLAFEYTGDARLMYGAIKLGGFGLLLPVYFAVCHRMLPFFASCVIPGYEVDRPVWALVTFVGLVLLHLVLELAHAFAWLFVPDTALALLCVALLRRWWPRGAAMPALLRVLFVGFAWLPVAFALYAAQSAWFAAGGVFVLGRAPAHALFVGYFGSQLDAMVTRVTQGHSGRPLELGRVAGYAFVAVQLVAIVRIAAELAPDAPAWQAVAAVGWIVAFAPWVVRSSWIYLTPRADGKPG
jgi:uncharacterized protein involved in response to NO